MASIAIIHHQMTWHVFIRHWFPLVPSWSPSWLLVYPVGSCVPWVPLHHCTTSLDVLPTSALFLSSTITSQAVVVNVYCESLSSWASVMLTPWACWELCSGIGASEILTTDACWEFWSKFVDVWFKFSIISLEGKTNSSCPYLTISFLQYALWMTILFLQYALWMSLSNYISFNCI